MDWVLGGSRQAIRSEIKFIFRFNPAVATDGKLPSDFVFASGRNFSVSCHKNRRCDGISAMGCSPHKNFRESNARSKRKPILPPVLNHVAAYFPWLKFCHGYETFRRVKRLICNK
jgi:hypothetical protein